MKIFFILSLVATQTSAFAESAHFSETVKCRVESINGNLGSFVPPLVGEEIVIDASQGTLGDLRFSGRGMIPVQKILVKNSMPDTGTYMLYFQADQHESKYEKNSLTVMVGKFRGEGGTTVYSGQIQSVTLSKHSGMLQVDEATLGCEVVH